MIIHKYKVRTAFTLVELMVTVLAAIVLIIGVSAMLAQGHFGYRRLFNRVNSEVVRNAYEARMTFDRIVRKSSAQRFDPRNADYEFLAEENQVYVYYFSNPQDMTIVVPDRYARFYLSGTELRLEQGRVTGGVGTSPPGLPTLVEPTDMILARDVIAPESGVFAVQGNALRMVLTLDNETDPEPGVSKIETLKMTVTTMAIRHN